jgi:Tfp pilus assembly protein PilZ
VTEADPDEVDLSGKLAWIHPDRAKARKAIAMPLNDSASVSEAL